MHRTPSFVLGALVALAACQKSSPPPVRPPLGAAPASAPFASLPVAPPADAGPVAEPVPAPVPPTLGLVHVDNGPANHLARARMLREEGDSLGALAEGRRALADAPEDEDALVLVARTAASLGQRGLAAAAFEKLAGLREEDAVPLLQAARLHLQLRDEVGAARLAAQALSRDEGNVEAYQVLGRAALLEGDLGHALEWLEQARALAPAHGWVLNNLGFAYLRAGENAQALETLSRAVELLPEVAVVHNNLGVALERQGRTEEARAAFEKSAALAPRYTRALVNRARLALLHTQDGGAAPTPEEDEAADTGEE